MQYLIEQVASNTGIDNVEVNRICKAFACELVCKVPALKQVIDDVFDNAEDATLKTHLNKLILNLQEQQGKETFGKWIIPQQNEIIHWQGSRELF